MWWIAAAAAGSLDLLEVGGPWGTPASTGPTAVWYNPAALSFGRGTRILIEGAPLVGGVNFDRTEPEYAWSAPSACAETPDEPWCARPVYGGLDHIRALGMVPFLGIATDAGVPGLGLGAALYVPHARLGDEVEEPGSGRTHLRGANVQAIYTSVAASWAWRDVFGVGASASWVHASWYARIDNESATSFRDFEGVGPLLGNELQPTSVEDPSLLVLTEFGPLRDNTASFQAGLYLRPPVRGEPGPVSLSVGYAYGARVDHKGDVSLTFGCPDPGPYPLLGSAIGASRFGVCDAQMRGDSQVGYRYPMRLNVGVQVTAAPELTVELLGGWVRWSEYTDFEIQVSNVESLNTEITEDTATALQIDRKWARANQDNVWVGVDVKGRVHDRLTLGGRLTFDRHAVPSYAMGTNNADFDTFLVSGLAAVDLLKQASPHSLQLGLSYSGHVALPRLVTDSAFRVDVDPEARVEDRFMYPEANGRYSSNLHRLGLSLKGTFATPQTKAAP